MLEFYQTELPAWDCRGGCDPDDCECVVTVRFCSPVPAGELQDVIDAIFPFNHDDAGPGETCVCGEYPCRGIPKCESCGQPRRDKPGVKYCRGRQCKRARRKAAAAAAATVPAG